MRQIFRGYYSLKDERSVNDVWNSEKTIFVFDTNCLLNLYRCEDSTREDILSVMKKVSSRTWLPFYVCLEYQKNRRGVICDSIDNLKSISTNLLSAANSITSTLSKGKVKKHLYSALSESVQQLQDDVKPIIESFIMENIDPRIISKEEINKSDVIRDSLDEIVGLNCGNIPTQEWINNVNTLGLARYSKQLPPGYKDGDKTDKKFFFNLEFDEKYGDLYIWREIIEKCKKDSIENVIFICDDNKEDWWYKKNGITHGALEYLQTEIYTESEVKNFKLINQASFLKDAQAYLPNINISPESLDEIKDLSEYYEHVPNFDDLPVISNYYNEISKKNPKPDYITNKFQQDINHYKNEIITSNHYLLSDLMQEISRTLLKIDKVEKLLTLLPVEQLESLETQINQMGLYSENLIGCYNSIAEIYKNLQYTSENNKSKFINGHYVIQQADTLIKKSEDLLSFFDYFFKSYDIK